jgi:hypothetical protein
VSYSLAAQQGWYDYRSGLPFPRDYDTWAELDQRNYENGRQCAANYKLATGRIPPTHVTPTTYKHATAHVGHAFYKAHDPNRTIVPLWQSTTVRG